MIHREWILSAGVKRFVARAVEQPHEFAAHDRSAPASEFTHMYEKARGIRSAWPDTELVVPGLTFRCELKYPPNKVRPGDEQDKLIRRLNAISGSAAAWADSVYGYGVAALEAGVPLLGNWEVVARHEDELVAGEVRKQEAKAEAAPLKPRAKTWRRPTPTQVARAERNRLLPK